MEILNNDQFQASNAFLKQVDPVQMPKLQQSQKERPFYKSNIKLVLNTKGSRFFG